MPNESLFKINKSFLEQELAWSNRVIDIAKKNNKYKPYLKDYQEYKSYIQKQLKIFNGKEIINEKK